MRWVNLYFLGLDVLLAGSIAVLWTALFRGGWARSAPPAGS
jgi:hypothetical protein